MHRFFDVKISPSVDKIKHGSNKKQKIAWSFIDRINVNKLLLSRIFVVLCLVSTAVLVGWGSFFFLTSIQDDVEEEEFSSVVGKLTSQAQTSITSTITLLEVLRDAMINKCPDASFWPNCGMDMDYFAILTDSLLQMISMRTIAFAPMVLPSQISSFETFAYQFLADNNRSDLGISDFGEGIYGVRNGSRYRMTNATTNGKHDALFPIFEAGDLPHNTEAIMYNIYDEIYRVTSIDYSIDCIDATPDADCTSITDIIHLVQDPMFRPAGLITLAFRLNESDTTIRGVVYTAINWDTVLSSEVAHESYASDVDAVLSTGSDEYSFRFQNGQAIFLGRGDYHNTKFNDRRRDTVFSQLGSTTFSVTYYPTQKWVDENRNSSGPLAVILITIGVMFLMSTALYDHLINRENEENDLVMDTKRQFVRYISHEIRTPLNVVHLGLKVLYTEMVKLISKCKSDDPSMERYKISDGVLEILNDWLVLISETETSSDVAIDVLNDLINYDKIDTGTLKIEISAIYFWDIVTTAVTPFYVQARHLNVELVLDMELQRNDIDVDHKNVLKRLLVLGDRVKLSQVIKNLISNALKFTSSGGKVTLTVIWKPDGLPNTVIEDKDSYKSAGSVIITCKDNGAGLSADNLKDLFREGVQFNANVLQAGQGSGLGLCITKGIVELHQGSIHATSEGIGHGATFVVEIPVVNEINNRDVELGSERSCSSGETVGMGATKILPELERDASGVGGSGKERIPGDPSVNKKKNYVVKRKITNILVVDDVALNRKIVCRLMRGEGYVCFEAADGQECVDYMKRCQEGTQEPVDLILMDYEMPRMNGPTATEVLISSGILVPVIGITGNALKDDFEFFINHGALAVLTKPLAVPGLSVWIDKLNSECECECDTPSPPINMKTQGADGISLSVSKSQSKSNANVDKEGFEQCENFLS